MKTIGRPLYKTIGRVIGKGAHIGSKLNLSPEIEAYISGLTTPLSSAQVIKLDTFIKALKTGLNINALSDVFDVMYVLGNETAEAGLRNLVKNAHHATAVNSPAFTAFEGFAGNAIDSYIRSNYKPLSNHVNFTLNDAGMGVYSRTNIIGKDQYEIGGRDSSSSKVNVFGLSMIADNAIRAIINGTSAGAPDSLVTNSNTTGLFTANRIDSGSIKVYNNKSLMGTKLHNSDIAMTDFEMYLLSANNGGTPLAFSQRQISFAFFSRALTAAENNVVCDAFEAYMDSNGKGVIS
jgi:hypothetical protein